MALLTSIYVTHSFKRSTALALRYVGMPVRKEVVLPLAGFPKPFCKNFSFPQSLKIFHWKIKLLRIDGRISFFTLALLGIPA